ncbi:MAG: ketopantoate reductase family protein, partial [Acidimicrobiia bacterium]
VVAISNSVSGALDLPVYDVLASASARRLLRAGREEAVAVATALGVGIDGAAMLERLEAMGSDAVGATSGSTYQSLSTGRRPEVDDISGALVQLGHDLGIPTPVNEMLALMTEARCEVAGLSR